MSGKKEGNIDFIFTWIVSYDQDVGFWFHFVPEITALLQKKRGNEMHKVAIVLKLDSKTFHSGAKTFIKLHYVLSYFKGYELTNWRIPKEFQKDAKIILKKFRKISKEFRKSSKRIPKGFLKEFRRDLERLAKGFQNNLVSSRSEYFWILFSVRIFRVDRVGY